MKAGEKSLKRYAVEEAHQYYQEAFDLLKNKTQTREDELLLGASRVERIQVNS